MLRSYSDLWATLALLSLCVPGIAEGQIELMPPSATAASIGLRVLQEGDTSDGTPYSVRFRVYGESAWRDALPLRAVSSRAGRALFAGSVLGLDPGTQYEIEILSPHGGGKRVTLETRTPPKLHPGRVVSVTPGASPGGLSGALEAARPGDVLELGPGEYIGPFTISRGGNADRPITLIGSSEGSTVLRNPPDQIGSVVRAAAADHVVLRDLTIAGSAPAPAIRGGNARHWTISGCLVFGGVLTGSLGWWIEDNFIVGRQRHWQPTRDKHPGGTGIQALGREHVVLHNQVSYFYDGINTAKIFNRNAEWPFAPEGPQRAVDIIGNLIFATQDDAIQVDHVGVNIRVHANRIFWSFAGISLQDLFPGPVYATRNVISDVAWESWKIMGTTRGIRLYNNTSVSTFGNISTHPPKLSDGRILNNLLVGRQGLFIGTEDPLTLWDHNAYAFVDQRGGFRWSNDGTNDWSEFAGLEEFSTTTGQERHGVVASVPEDLAGPVHLKPSRPPLDGGALLPTADSALVGRGMHIPTVTPAGDGKPPIGAYGPEIEVPTYGPRRIIPGALHRGYYDDVNTLRLTTEPVGYSPLSLKERIVRFIDVHNISLPLMTGVAFALGLLAGLLAGWLLWRRSA